MLKTKMGSVVPGSKAMREGQLPKEKGGSIRKKKKCWGGVGGCRGAKQYPVREEGTEAETNFTSLTVLLGRKKKKPVG